jgi:hypothetical protein
MENKRYLGGWWFYVLLFAVILGGYIQSGHYAEDWLK